MNHSLRLFGILSLVVVLLAVTLVGQEPQQKKKKKKAAQQSPAAALLRQLDRAQLTEEQKVQIKELIAKKSDAIVALRQKVAMTPELRRALNEATTKLRAEGKRGAELRSAAATAAGLGAEQIAAQQELTQAMNQLRREAFSLLTDEQRQAIGRGAQGKANKKKKAADATDA